MAFKTSLIYIIVLFVTINISFSQNTYLLNDSLNLDTKLSSFDKNKAKLSYGLELGSTFVNIGSGVSYNYVSPYVLYPLSNKLTLELGMRISTGNMFPVFNPYYTEQYNSLSSNMFQKTFYARAHYSINPNMSVFGTGYFQNNLLFSDDINNKQSFNTKAMSLGFEYKISNSASFQFEIQTGNLYNQNYYNTNLFAPTHLMFR